MSNLHTVTIEFDGGFPSLRFTCHDVGVDPACRMVCPQPECEEGCYYPDEHTRENVGECCIVTWLQEGDADECILDGSTQVTLPIEYKWHGEGVDWKFAEVAS